MFGNACLEGTTERSDGNRARSVRRDEANLMCLEGTTPQDMLNFILHKISPKSNPISTICIYN